ncbi:hypothetical protein HYO62_00480 [Aerococcaceae bacterium DSM 111022]|nr:hypothetical protein [Aerococcaceae bacterium DSM 111022]
MELIVAGVSALVGFLISHIYYNHEKNRNKHEKAIEVAKEFETILNSDHFIVQSVFSEIIETLEFEDKFTFLQNDVAALSFTKQELYTYFSENEVEKYKNFNKYTNVTFIKILSKHYTETNSDERFFASVISQFDSSKTLDVNIKEFKDNLKNSKETDQSDESNKELFKIQMKIQTDLRIYVINLFKKFNVSYNHVFNKLEWMSMYFVTGVADSDAVYKSLHQVYFVLMKCFYIEIAMKNDKEVYDRYFTNITNLYKIWRLKYNKEKASFDEIANNAERAHSKIKKRV